MAKYKIRGARVEAPRITAFGLGPETKETFDTLLVVAPNETEACDLYVNNLIDDDILNTFAVVGTPAEVADKIATRFGGKVERISPVIYQPDVPLLSALREDTAAAMKRADSADHADPVDMFDTLKDAVTRHYR